MASTKTAAAGKKLEAVAREVLGRATMTERGWGENVRQEALIGTADCAKLVRAALADAFPAVTFSVRSRTYAGGSSVDVTWTDGPTAAMVDAVAKRFEGATFDGMIDLKGYKSGQTLEGVAVSYCADYVMCQRGYSYEFLRRRAEAVAAKWGVPAPRVSINRWGAVEVDRDGAPIAGGNGFRSETAGDKLMEEAHKTAVVPQA